MGRRARKRREKRKTTRVPVEAEVEVSEELRPARQRREKKRPTRPRRRPRYLRILTGTTAAAVVATVLIVVSLAPWESEAEGTPSEFIIPTPRPADMPRQGTTLGSPDAPLTIVEYSDFQCPFCRKASLEIVPQFEADYIATGKAKLTFKHFPIEGQESPGAAEATECAAEQNAFWEYHDMLYLNRRGVDVGTFVPDNLKIFAKELGLDTEKFNACLDEGKYRDKIVDDYNEAHRREVPGTPTFFVGQTMVVGAKPYSAFKAAIDDELARLGETSEAE
jgi:protein-disulfide isomerase